MEVRIRVGVSVDQSMKYAFRPLVQAAIEARRLILKEFGQVPKEITALFAAGGRGQAQAYRGVVSEARAAAREQQSLAKKTADEEIRSAKLAAREQANETKRALAEMRRDHASYEREARASSRRQAQEAARSAREVDRFASRTSHYGARYFAPHMPIASFAHRAANGIVHGFGVDPTFSGALERNIELESQAVRISNQASLAGQHVSPEEIQDAVRRVSNQYGLSRGAAVEAVQHFTDTGGDTKMGLQVLERLANRSIVTSTNINDLAQTAADASMHMGDVPDKLNKLFGTIDNLGVQSDRGAIAMRQVARQSPKLLSSATMFGGDVEHNQATMGALVQIARKGGAWSPQSAASGVVSFVNTLQKSARLKEFDKAGIRVYNSDNTLRDPIELIKEMMLKTDADPRKMNKLVMDQQAKRVTNYFAHLYREGGGGAGGLSAIDKEVGRFMNDTKITPEEEQAAIAKKQQSTAFQVQQFQNAMDDVANELRIKLLPILKDAQPEILKFVRGMGELAAWAVENPGKAIVAAIVASIARAGLESALRAVLERAITAAAGGGRFGRVMGALPIAGAVLGLGAIAAGDIAASDNAANHRIKDEGSSLNQFRALGATPKTVTAAQKEQMYRNIIETEEDLKSRKRKNNALGGGFFDISGQWDWLKGHFQENSPDLEIKSREGMLAEKKRIYDKIRTTPQDAEQKDENWKRVVGKPGETLDQLRERIVGENAKAKQDAADRALQEKSAANLEKLAMASSGGALKVAVQNFPKEDGGDSPTAPAPG